MVYIFYLGLFNNPTLPPSPKLIDNDSHYLEEEYEFTPLCSLQFSLQNALIASLIHHIFQIHLTIQITWLPLDIYQLKILILSILILVELFHRI